MEYFKKNKHLIEKSLLDYLDGLKPDYAHVNHWGSDICSRLYDFTANGKMIRGGLVLLAHDLYRGKRNDDAVKTAAVMELFQSAFLIHDDIMDKDTVRRGNPSFFYQYKQKGDSLGFADSYHFGESLGICAGDIAFFIGYDILSSLSSGNDKIREIIKTCSREISFVGLAQMQDVQFGYTSEPPTTDEILLLYLYKTGRYTFSLPLVLGALLADKPVHDSHLLSKLGEKLGLIFQIKDDELGLFGDSKQIGKVVGSDIRENKKSLYHHFLFTRADTDTKSKLNKIFGSKDITDSDIKLVRDTVEKMGIRKEVDDLVAMIATEANTIMNELSQSDVNPEALSVIKNLLQYSLTRSK